MAAVLEVLLERAKAGRIVSLAFIAEEQGRRKPHDGIVGRLRSDPKRAIGELAVMKEKLAGFAAEQDPGFSESVM